MFVTICCLQLTCYIKKKEKNYLDSNIKNFQTTSSPQSSLPRFTYIPLQLKIRSPSPVAFLLTKGRYMYVYTILLNYDDLIIQ